MFGRGESSRLRTDVRRAIKIYGGRLTTRDACEFCYPDQFVNGPVAVNPKAYAYTRATLAQYCRPIGRARGGGRPILWEVK